LYESLGFSVEGVQRGYFLFEDGTLEDDVVMSLRLADLG
jgi:RimJ/RimL family protein N-acetyltransferase